MTSDGSSALNEDELYDALMQRAIQDSSMIFWVMSNSESCLRANLDKCDKRLIPTSLYRLHWHW